MCVFMDLLIVLPLTSALLGLRFYPEDATSGAEGTPPTLHGLSTTHVPWSKHT